VWFAKTLSAFEINTIGRCFAQVIHDNQRLMLHLIRFLFASILRVFRTRRSLVLENLVLRQQLIVLKRKHPRPRLVTLDRLFWVLAQRFWSDWKQALIIVSPDTVVRWHRAGFALYWRAMSRARRVSGRKRISKEVRDLIFRMVDENPTWGAPRNPEPAKRWLTFLRNHREAIAAMDFFTVPTITFGLLYGFFIISHDRRHILHFNVTKHPTSMWIVQQLREAFPYRSSPKFLIFDRDSKYGLEVTCAVRSMAIRPVRTSNAEHCYRQLPKGILASADHCLFNLRFSFRRS